MIWLLRNGMEFENGPKRYPIVWDFKEFYALCDGSSNRCEWKVSLSFAKSSLLFHSLLKRELQNKCKLGPVGSTVRFKVMKLCTGSVWDSNGWYLVVLSQYKAVPVPFYIKTLHTTFIFGYLVCMWTSTSFSTHIVIIFELINRYDKEGHRENCIACQV